MRRAIACATALVVVGAVIVLAGTPAEAQQKGQSAKIHYGVVVRAERVDLSDSKVTEGALIGGTIGLVGTSSRSCPRSGCPP